MAEIYITHCSKKKDDTLKDTEKKVTPNNLYRASPLLRFISACKEKKVEWAIFSDKYGVVFPREKIEWYEKSPSKVNEVEFQLLLRNFYLRLSSYDKIWFYHNPGRFHGLYNRLVKESKRKGMNISLFSHISDIE